MCPPLVICPALMDRSMVEAPPPTTKFREEAVTVQDVATRDTAVHDPLPITLLPPVAEIEVEVRSRRDDDRVLENNMFEATAIIVVAAADVTVI